MISKSKRSLVLGALLIVALAVVILNTAKNDFRSRSGPNQPTTAALNSGNGNSSANMGIGNSTANSSPRLDRARQLIKTLRGFAIKTNDVQALCYGNAALLAELRTLGPDLVTASLDEIADKTAPESLRILLIEIATSMVGRSDDRVGGALMTIITDPEDSKAVKMQALQWIPVAGDQPAGVSLLEMLPKQTDSDLEFGITRALEGFQVPGSDGILQAELGGDKSYLTRIAASHALAKQGGAEALAVLQKLATSLLAGGSDEAHPEQNAIAVHAVLALGEIPDASSLPILESVLNNPANSISVRSKAAEVLGTVAGPEGASLLRNAVIQEPDESVLVYIARGLARCGKATDAELCLKRAATVSDSYTKNQLERAASELQTKARK
jgi:hypothetical protein